MIAHVAALTFNVDMHRSLMPSCHLASQGYHVGIVPGIGISKNGLSEKARGIRMDKETSVPAQQHEVGIFVGMRNEMACSESGVKFSSNSRALMSVEVSTVPI